MNDLAEGRMRRPDSSSEVFGRVGGPNAEATPISSEEPAARDRTKTELPTAGRASSTTEADPRLAALRARHPTHHAPILFPEHALAAADLPVGEVRARLARLTDYVAARVQAGELPSVDLPDLHRANSIYDDRGNVFVGHNVRRLALDRRDGKAFMRLLLAAETASDNLRSGVCTTKRGLYYQHQAKLPDEDAGQVESDRALAALASLLGVRRSALGFVEARRGSVHGRLVIRDGAEVRDLSQLGSAGYATPRFTDNVEIVNSDAAFILIVEKHSVAFKLAQARCDAAHAEVSRPVHEQVAVSKRE